MAKKPQNATVTNPGTTPVTIAANPLLPPPNPFTPPQVNPFQPKSIAPPQQKMNPIDKSIPTQNIMGVTPTERRSTPQEQAAFGEDFNRRIRAAGSMEKAVAQMKAEQAETPEAKAARALQIKNELENVKRLENAGAINTLNTELPAENFTEDKAGFGELAKGAAVDVGLYGGGGAAIGAGIGAALSAPTAGLAAPITIPAGAIIGGAVGIATGIIKSVIKKKASDSKASVSQIGSRITGSTKNINKLYVGLNKGENPQLMAEAFQIEVQNIATSKRYLQQKLIDDPVTWDDPNVQISLEKIETFERQYPNLKRNFEAAMLNPNPNIIDYPEYEE